MSKCQINWIFINIRNIFSATIKAVQVKCHNEHSLTRERKYECELYITKSTIMPKSG